MLRVENNDDVLLTTFLEVLPVATRSTSSINFMEAKNAYLHMRALTYGTTNGTSIVRIPSMRWRATSLQMACLLKLRLHAARQPCGLAGRADIGGPQESCPPSSELSFSFGLGCGTSVG